MILCFQLSGLVLGGSGLWTYYTHYPYLVLMETLTYFLITWMLIATGALILLAGIVGCVAVNLEKRCMVAMVSEQTFF